MNANAPALCILLLAASMACAGEHHADRLRHGTEEERAVAAEALVALGAEGVPALCTIVADEEASKVARKTACYGLERIGLEAKTALEVLAQAQCEDDPGLQRAAEAALEAIVPPSAPEDLVSAAAHESDFVRAQACAALRSHGEEGLEVLLRAWHGATDLEKKAHLRQSLVDFMDYEVPRADKPGANKPQWNCLWPFGFQESKPEDQKTTIVVKSADETRWQLLILIHRSEACLQLLEHVLKGTADSRRAAMERLERFSKEYYWVKTVLSMAHEWTSEEPKK